MSTWRILLVPLLCARLAGVSWGQTAVSSLEYLTQGIVAYEQGQWEECAGSLEKALAQGFDDPLYRLDALVFLGRVHARLGQDERARTYFRQVLEIQPDYRLDPSDEAGVELFRFQLEGDPPTADEGGFPKKWIIAPVAAGVAAVAYLLTRPPPDDGILPEPPDRPGE